MSDRYSITESEIGLLQEKMQDLSPGYRMCDLNSFREPLRAAADRWKGDESLRDPSRAINTARLMRRVLTDPKREGYGIPFPWWWCMMDMRLFHVKQDPWREVKWWQYEELRGKRKNLILHGAQSTGKSGWMGSFCTLQMAVWIEHCIIYISGPYKNAADDKIWGDSFKRSLEIIKRPGNPFADALRLRIIIESENCEVYDTITGERATAKFLSLENAASVQGKKSLSHEDDGLIGIIAFFIDEFIENPGIKLKQAEGNLASNHNYFGCFACNPLPAKVNHVGLRKFSAPIDRRIETMSKTRDFRWQSAYGIVARFSKFNCPNMLLERTVWPYMLNEGMIIAAEEKDNEIIAAQVEAWAWESSGQQYLDPTAVELAGTYLKPVWRTAQTRFMMVDCAFGGGDLATATIMESGMVDLPDDYRRPVNKPVMGGVGQIILKVEGDFVFTADWYQTMMELFEYTGGGFPDTIRISPFREGQLIPASYKLAQRVIEAMIEYNVPAGNVTFDSSQRGDCTDIMQAALGRANVKWFYDGLRPLKTEEDLTADWYIWPFVYEKSDEHGMKVAKKWSELCTRPISMMWLFACNFIRHGNLINGKNVEKGIEELMARPIEVGRAQSSSWRRDVLSKEKLKDLGMRSPTYGEGLALGIYFGVRFLGLIPLGRPELNSVVQQTSQFTGIISAGKNVRFNMDRKKFFGDK